MMRGINGDEKNHFLLLVILVYGAHLVTACSSTPQNADDDHVADEHIDDNDHGDDVEYAHIDPPHEYGDLYYSFGDGDHEAVEVGEAIYVINCATCRGPEGDGDGPAAEGLDPKPANLANAQIMEDLNDAYLFWRVSEGGILEPFISGMPPWKDILAEDERWQVITFSAHYLKKVISLLRRSLSALTRR